MLWRCSVILALSALYLFAVMLINAKTNRPAKPPTKNAMTTHHIDIIHLVAGVPVLLFPHSAALPSIRQRTSPESDTV